jgi:iron(III) transport system substrate-binding protein
MVMKRTSSVQTKKGHLLMGIIAATVFVFLLCVFPLTTAYWQGNMAWAAAAGGLDSIIAAANKEGKLMWYESSPDDQFAKVEAAFNKRYPKIKLEQTRLRGAEVGTRIIAESQANAPTADVGTTGLDILIALNDRGLLAKPNWTEFGIPGSLIATPYATITRASIYIFSYNTKLVSEAEAPKKWEDMLLPKWKGKIGLWQKNTALAFLQPVWGEEKTIDYTKKLADQKPVLYQSNMNLNDAMAAGEILVSITNYHSVFPTIERGGPVKIVFPEFIPYEAICSSIPAKSPSPNAAKVFLNWLSSFEGSTAYERATYSGNPWITGTETYKVLNGKKLSSFKPEQTQYFADLVVRIEKIITGR